MDGAADLWCRWMWDLDGLPADARLRAILQAGFPSWTGRDGWTTFAMKDGREHMVRGDRLAALEDGVFRPPSGGKRPPWSSPVLACMDLPVPPPLPPRPGWPPAPWHDSPSRQPWSGPDHGDGQSPRRGSGADPLFAPAPVADGLWSAPAQPEPPPPPPPPLPSRPPRPPLRNPPPRAAGPQPTRRTAQAAAQRDLSDLGL